MVRATAVMTTTRPTDAYGGVRLPLNVLTALADALNIGSMPMNLNHDTGRRLSIANMHAGVRQCDDGEYEAWAEFDVDDDEWTAYRAEATALGLPPDKPIGMSFTFVGTFANFESPSPYVEGLSFELAADPHDFPPREVALCARDLAVLGPSGAQCVFQFGVEPPALVVVGAFLADGAAQVMWGFVSAYLWEAVRRLKGDKSAAINIEIEHGDRRLVANVPINTPAPLAQQAFATLERIADQTGLWSYDSESGWTYLHAEAGRSTPFTPDEPIELNYDRLFGERGSEESGEG